MSFINSLGLWPQTETNHTGLIVTGTAIATTVVILSLRSYLWPTPRKIDRSPLRSVLPQLSQHELAKLDYKPDAFPGARDVETPYGSIRVYEWGPQTGDKVLFVHGISTSCLTLYKLANALANERGCRVMLFDLFGRGYSDNPSDLPHDARLYTTQILLALASSPELSWTGPQAFKMVGYSLGGGIAVHFATTFPHLVSSLVLLAPAGLIRPESFGVLARAVFTSGLVPPRLLARITRHRLKKPIRSSGKRTTNPSTTTTTTTTTAKPDPVAASLAETTPLLPTTATTNPHPSPNPTQPLSEPESEPEPANALEQRVLRAVHWQLAHHPGFVPAFMSCIRSAPLIGQHDAWSRLAARAPGTTAIILGKDDEIIDPEEYAADALPLINGNGEGEGRVKWAVVPGGHDFPMTFAREVLEEMGRVWGWE